MSTWSTPAESPHPQPAPLADPPSSKSNQNSDTGRTAPLVLAHPREADRHVNAVEERHDGGMGLW